MKINLDYFDAAFFAGIRIAATIVVVSALSVAAIGWFGVLIYGMGRLGVLITG